MSSSKIESKTFDVFLCHNSEDKSEIRRISDDLTKKGIKPWLDEREIIPGTLWQAALEEQISNIKSVAVFIGRSGIGPWQSMEIKASIDQFVKRNCPVIPVFLSSLQGIPEIPILLQNFHSVDFRKLNPEPLQQLIVGITSEKNQVSRLFDDPQNDNIAALSKQIDLRTYHPLTETPPKEQLSQLLILRDRVKEFWIDGILKQSLHHEVLISLGKELKDKAVETPLHRIIELTKQRSQFPNSTPIETVFDATGLLLILGEPGSGKTTTLLQLVDYLIERTETNDNERIPVVLNLSSWKKKQLLSDWIVDSLHRLYNIPTKLARSWLDRGYLVPLLDGLDEIKTEEQAHCVKAINAYITQTDPAGLVICSRLMEYQWLPERLKLYGAICIEPLKQQQINEYFTAIGSEFDSLYRAIQKDILLQELSQSPLMLSVMSMAYQSANPEFIVDDGKSLEIRRTQILDAYVDKMFERKEAAIGKAYPKEKVIYWLSWLAKKMAEQSQSVFFIENLQPSWVDGWKQRIAYIGISMLNYGLFSGLLLGFVFSLLFYAEPNLIFFGLILGLIFGLIAFVFSGAPNSIKTIEIVSWSWSSFFTKVSTGFLTGMSASGFLLWYQLFSWSLSRESVAFLITVVLLYLAIKMIFYFIGAIINGLIDISNNKEPANDIKNFSIQNFILLGIIVWQYYKNFFLYLSQESIFILTSTLQLGLFLGLIYGVVSGAIGGFTNKISESKTRPNQGIILTIRNGMFFGFISIIIVGIIFALIQGLFVYLQLQGETETLNRLLQEQTGESLNKLKEGLIFSIASWGAIFGLFVIINRGLGSVIKHYSLRLFLYLSGKTPLFSKFIPFLDYCAKLILLKKVGGGYIFVHRMVHEYFAKLGTVASKTK